MSDLIFVIEYAPGYDESWTLHDDDVYFTTREGAEGAIESLKNAERPAWYRKDLSTYEDRMREWQEKADRLADLGGVPAERKPYKPRDPYADYRYRVVGLRRMR